MTDIQSESKLRRRGADKQEVTERITIKNILVFRCGVTLSLRSSLKGLIGFHLFTHMFINRFEQLSDIIGFVSICLLFVLIPELECSGSRWKQLAKSRLI